MSNVYFEVTRQSNRVENIEISNLIDMFNVTGVIGLRSQPSRSVSLYQSWLW